MTPGFLAERLGKLVVPVLEIESTGKNKELEDSQGELSGPKIHVCSQHQSHGRGL